MSENNEKNEILTCYNDYLRAYFPHRAEEHKLQLRRFDPYYWGSKEAKSTLDVIKTEIGKL